MSTDTVYEVYTLENALASFFSKTSASRSQCDDKARELAGGEVVAIAVQGCSSYTVYVGESQEYVVQFRLRSLALKLETAELARKIHGSFVPEITFSGELGTDGNDGRDEQVPMKEPLLVYLISRVPGMTYLDFRLAHDQDSPEAPTWRRNAMEGVARFLGMSWKAPQRVDSYHRDRLRQEFRADLHRLLAALPSRFHPAIQTCLDAMDQIFSLLPMVLLHRDFDACDIMVDDSCHLTGVVGWATAEASLFGMNLHAFQFIMGELRSNGWNMHPDRDNLCAVFWKALAEEVGGVTEDIIHAMKTARIMGLLLSYGFTSRLANHPARVPIGDDERGRYNMLSLDGFLINPATRFD